VRPRVRSRWRLWECQRGKLVGGPQPFGWSRSVEDSRGDGPGRPRLGGCCGLRPVCLAAGRAHINSSFRLVAWRSQDGRSAQRCILCCRVVTCPSAVQPRRSRSWLVHVGVSPVWPGRPIAMKSWGRRFHVLRHDCIRPAISRAQSASGGESQKAAEGEEIGCIQS